MSISRKGEIRLEMRILILGAGNCQLNLIRKAIAMGHQVIVSDYLPDAPGKKLADFSTSVSSFDWRGNLKVAQQYEVEAVLTTGTDQPVYTAAQIAAALEIPHYITPQIALSVTNKRIMKQKFTQAGIPTVKYKLLQTNFSDAELTDFKLPIVVKPVDSQGQRGVYKLDSIEELRAKFSEVLAFSRENRLLVEEYYPAAEITVSGWVRQGRLHLLTVTDRINFARGNHLGICSSHLFPSRYLKSNYLAINELSENIVTEFKINNGPIYFQFLLGQAGLKVNEIAVRIGGAYEDIFIPALTGVDILKLNLKLAVGEAISSSELASLNNYQLLNNKSWLSAQLFFSQAGKIVDQTPAAELMNLAGVLKADYNFKPGDQLAEIDNATARAGYFLVKAAGEKELRQRIAAVYDKLEIIDQQGKNLVLRQLGENF